MSNKKSFLDSNGLVDGNIPKGKPCPFLNKCGLRNERCPTEEKPNNEFNYSCAAARAWSLCVYQPNGTMQGILEKKSNNE